MARTSTTRYAILGALAVQPMSGYEIRRFVAETVGHFWGESYGQLYPTLTRLAEEGLAVLVREEPGKKTYAITGAGEQELRAWAAGPVEQRPPRNELLLRLFFGRHVPTPRLIELVSEARARQARALQWYREAQEAPEEDRAHPDFPYWSMTLRFGLVMGEQYLSWCDETIEQLRNLQHRGTARS